MEEGIFKEINGALERINSKSFIVESWRSVKKRLQEQHPTAKIKYSKGRYTVTYPLPSDMFTITAISTESNASTTEGSAPNNIPV